MEERFLRIPSAATDEIELLPKGAPESTATPEPIQHETYDRGASTRYLCLSALLTSWVVGIVCVALAATVFRALQVPDEQRYAETGEWPHRWPQINVSPTVGELLPLLLNAIMTVILEGLGLIHATTLRWALGQDLTFNANLRLFTPAKTSIALSRPANFLFALLLILCYTSTSLFFVNPPGVDFCETHKKDGLSTEGSDCTSNVHISPPALYALGIGLLGQSALTTWQYATTKVPTWSSSPLDTAWAMIASHSRHRTPGRGILSVHDSNARSGPSPAQARQRPIWAAHSEARWIMYYVWTSLVISYLFFISIIAVIRANIARIGTNCNGCGTYVGPNWNIIPDFGGSATSTAIIQEQSATVHVGLFIIVFLVTGVVTLALHCVELITVLQRDEVTWRHCSTSQPYRARRTAVIRAATSWSFLLLFLLKVVLHWLSGKGIAYVYNWGIFLRPPQLLYLALGMTLLTGFATFLCFESPKGPQPAAYGHVQTLVDVVDEWALMMFWGEKGVASGGEHGWDGEGEVRKVGTAGLPLGDVVVGCLYE